MTQHMVRYTVRTDQAAHNEELIRGVLDEMNRVQPAGLRYAALKLDDDVSFVHLVWHDTKNAHGPLPHLRALTAFHSNLRERCDDVPVRTEFAAIGSFRLFGED